MGMQIIRRVKKVSASVTVRRELIELIKTGYFADGMLPSEGNIANMFGVSRVTVRDALAYLENMGYITRMQGRGTVINKAISTMTGRISEGMLFTEFIRSQGGEPSVAHGKVERVPIDPEVKEKLRTKADEMYRIEKQFMGDGKPMVFGINHFSTDYLNDNIFNFPMDETSIFTILHNHFNFPTIDYDILEILPYQADEYIASMLNIETGTALLKFESISMASHQTPVLINHEYYHPEYINFREVRMVNYE